MNEGMEIFKGCDFLFFGIKKNVFLIIIKKKSQESFWKFNFPMICDLDNLEIKIENLNLNLMDIFMNFQILWFKFEISNFKFFFEF